MLIKTPPFCIMKGKRNVQRQAVFPYRRIGFIRWPLFDRVSKYADGLAYRETSAVCNFYTSKTCAQLPSKKRYMQAILI